MIDEVLRSLKTEILSRDGKAVIRPDTGDPVDILCGDPNSQNPLEAKGVVELLWEIFGGTVNSKGYKELDPHIGCIYGDAITIGRCKEICRRLKEKGFASTNVVYGIGSYTYQYVTRDTFGFAVKSTHVTINGEEFNIYKDPVTDKEKFKKSLTGKVVVFKDGSGFKTLDQLTSSQEMAIEGNLLNVVYCNGNIYYEDTLQGIRQRLANSK